MMTSATPMLAYLDEREKLTEYYVGAHLHWRFAGLALMSVLVYLWVRRSAVNGPLLIIVLAIPIVSTLLYVFYLILYRVGWRVVMTMGTTQTSRMHIERTYESLNKYDDTVVAHIAQMATVNSSMPTPNMNLTNAMWAVSILLLGWSVSPSGIANTLLLSELIILTTLGFLSSAEQGNADAVLKLAVAELQFQRQQTRTMQSNEELLTNLLVASSKESAIQRGSNTSLMSPNGR